MTPQLSHVTDTWFSLQCLKQLSQSFKQAAVFLLRESDGKYLENYKNLRR